MIAVGQVILKKGSAIRKHGKWTEQDKYHVCLCPKNGYYFYINTKGHHHFSFPVKKAEHDFLSVDCYIGCGNLLEIDGSYFEDDRGDFDGVCLGWLTADVLVALAQYIPEVKTLTQEEKDTIIKNLLDAASMARGR